MINTKIVKLEKDLIEIINKSGVEISIAKLILEKLTSQTERLLDSVLEFEARQEQEEQIKQEKEALESEDK